MCGKIKFYAESALLIWILLRNNLVLEGVVWYEI